MPKTFPHEFTSDHEVQPDGSLTFKCSGDADIWPWLALPPHDPIVVQTINYWAPVETGETRGTFDRAKWTALTQTSWNCPNEDTGHAVRGMAKPIDETNSLAYDISFYDDQDRLVYEMTGTGVVFQNRDFEAWRNAAKQKLSELRVSDLPGYASAKHAGTDFQSECFLSPLTNGETIKATGLVKSADGFWPNHRHITGSGDHVNATHIAEIGRQFASLLADGGPRQCIAGQIAFHRFVELDVPFEVQRKSSEDNPDIIALILSQAEKPCADIQISFAPK